MAGNPVKSLPVRQWIVGGYVIRYLLRDDQVLIIVRFWHGKEGRSADVQGVQDYTANEIIFRMMHIPAACCSGAESGGVGSHAPKGVAFGTTKKLPDSARQGRRFESQGSVPK